MNFEKIKGYPYVIHPCGTIIRLYKNHTKEMKPHKTKKGYMRIPLRKNGKAKNFLLHRLVALQFIPNPENKLTVDHINRIRDDNRVINLRWATYKEQQENAIRQPPRKITPGCISKTKSGYQWYYRIKGKVKTKTMKNKEDLIKYRDKILSAIYNNE